MTEPHNFLASAPQAARTAAEGAEVAAKARAGAIKVMTKVRFRSFIIANPCIH
jgi:hypothetical protein